MSLEHTVEKYGCTAMLDEIIKFLNEVKKDPSIRSRAVPMSREEAIALTHLETAQLWLEKAGWKVIEDDLTK